MARGPGKTISFVFPGRGAVCDWRQTVSGLQREAIFTPAFRAWLSDPNGRRGARNSSHSRAARARRAAKGAWDPAHIAGLYASCAKWLKQGDVAMVGSDAATDVMPSGVPGVVQPMHQLLLVAMGTPIFDNCDLEAFASAAAQRNRWVFLLTAAPIPVPGGTGSPLNPIATF